MPVDTIATWKGFEGVTNSQYGGSQSLPGTVTRGVWVCGLGVRSDMAISQSLHAVRVCRCGFLPVKCVALEQMMSAATWRRAANPDPLPIRWTPNPKT